MRSFAIVKKKMKSIQTKPVQIERTIRIICHGQTEQSISMAFGSHFSKFYKEREKGQNGALSSELHC